MDNEELIEPLRQKDTKQHKEFILEALWLRHLVVQKDNEEANKQNCKTLRSIKYFFVNLDDFES